MYRIFLFFLLLAAFGFGQGVPKLSIASTEHDLGEVKKSAGATHTFTFKNEGNADLVIKKVAPS